MSTKSQTKPLLSFQKESLPNGLTAIHVFTPMNKTLWFVGQGPVLEQVEKELKKLTKLLDN
jgi:hypothetical protein